MRNRGKTEKIGRNAKCQCGSGKKYKNCCMGDKKRTYSLKEEYKKRLSIAAAFHFAIIRHMDESKEEKLVNRFRKKNTIIAGPSGSGKTYCAEILGDLIEVPTLIVDATDYTEAEDTLHEGFMKVFQKIDQFKFKGSLAGWIRRVMINTALEKFRKQNQLYALGDDYESTEDIQQENVISDLSAQDLIKLIRELTPKYRMVFNLFAIEGYSHKEIGEMLGISEGTSKSNLARARYILQKKVKKYFYIKASIKDAK